MGMCSECGEKAGFMVNICDACWATSEANRKRSASTGSSPRSASKTTSKVSTPQSESKLTTVGALMFRYRDAYFLARVTTDFGSAIKILGIIIAVVIALLGIVGSGSAGRTANEYSAVVVIGSLVFGTIVGLFFYFVGILVSAQGQILKATLDSAVNTSPFLSSENRAKIMSLPFVG